jgi:hypothetical protein
VTRRKPNAKSRRMRRRNEARHERNQQRRPMQVPPSIAEQAGKGNATASGSPVQDGSTWGQP